jgi:hypothetical protein
MKKFLFACGLDTPLYELSGLLAPQIWVSTTKIPNEPVCASMLIQKKAMEFKVYLELHRFLGGKGI